MSSINEHSSAISDEMLDQLIDDRDQLTNIANVIR